MPRTVYERGLIRFLGRIAGGKNVILATGGGENPPSVSNPSIKWIFATSLTKEELHSIARPRTKLGKTDLRLIIVGRLEKGKGSNVLIESLVHIRSDFKVIHLDIIGDGSALPELKELAGRLGVKKHVSFHGQVSHDQVIAHLHQADLFCFPTTSEGFPKAVLEALACGLPVITTPISVLPDLLSGGCGVILKSRAPTDIAIAVRNCVYDEKRYRYMSNTAIKTAHNYSLERWGEQIGDQLRAKWGDLRSSG
jgi:glycosyltransferase involved in cell wall biosynthesis